MNRRQFLAGSSALLAGSFLEAAAGPPATKPVAPSTNAPTTLPTDLVWHDVRTWGLEGRAFNDTQNYFERLPARARGVVRDEVWDLSRHTAGMVAWFNTDAASIYVRYRLISDTLAMPHMPATGVSGVDLYAHQDNHWRWAANILPRSRNVEARLLATSPLSRTYQLYLPLYNGIESLEIGVPPQASFTGLPPRRTKPIVWYGTSITQGGCASRPGMAFTNILSRRLGVPIHNFGFSGNGRMEPEVGQFLTEIDAAAFVIDCNANMQAAQVKERTAPLVRQLRAARPKAPILLLEDRPWASGPKLAPATEAKQAQTREALRSAFESLREEGVEDLHYRAGTDLIGSDGEGTVDGSHPNDLGMMRYADALEADIRKLLARA